MNNTSTRNTNKLVVPGAKQALDQMKFEIAREFGVNLGPDTSARMAPHQPDRRYSRRLA